MLLLNLNKIRTAQDRIEQIIQEIHAADAARKPDDDPTE